jgi:biotin carboxylase
VCVVKPYRGVASDGVYLCRSKQAAKEGFEALLGQPQFGGGLNEAVLIQVSLVHGASAHWLCVW